LLLFNGKIDSIAAPAYDSVGAAKDRNLTNAVISVFRLSMHLQIHDASGTVPEVGPGLAESLLLVLLLLLFVLLILPQLPPPPPPPPPPKLDRLRNQYAPIAAYTSGRSSGWKISANNKMGNTAKLSTFPSTSSRVMKVAANLSSVYTNNSSWIYINPHNIDTPSSIFLKSSGKHHGPIPSFDPGWDNICACCTAWLLLRVAGLDEIGPEPVGAGPTTSWSWSQMPNVMSTPEARTEEVLVQRFLGGREGRGGGNGVNEGVRRQRNDKQAYTTLSTSTYLSMMHLDVSSSLSCQAFKNASLQCRAASKKNRQCQGSLGGDCR
jgi:hypothetical protein